MDLSGEDFDQEIGDILRHIDKLDIDHKPKDDLKNCLIGLREMDIKRLVDGVAACVKNVSLDTLISILIKFVNVINDLNDVLSLLPTPLGFVFKAVSVVCGAVFKTNIAAAIRQTFRELKEEELMEKCRVSCMKINHCFSYMRGLPDASTLSQEEKVMHLQLLSTDVNIFTGFDELTVLGDKIKHLATKDNLDEFGTLMNNVQFYCCLATLRELFLMYRYGIQLSFNVRAESIENVLISQRQHDKDVLGFLWKPTHLNVHFVHNYNSDDWPLTALFLEKRKLVQNLCHLLKGKSFHIESLENHKLLTSCKRFLKLPLPDAVKCKNSSRGTSSVFTLHGGDHNVFAIYGNSYLPELVHFESTCRFHVTFSSNDVTPKGLWHVIKIEPQTPTGEPCYMFRMMANPKMCLFAGLGSFVFATHVNHPMAACFWKLTRMKADDKGEYKEYMTMV
ncbi:hypothetical protein ACF0H5_006788 [Mactra antiquata]